MTEHVHLGLMRFFLCFVIAVLDCAVSVGAAMPHELIRGSSIFRYRPVLFANSLCWEISCAQPLWGTLPPLRSVPNPPGCELILKSGTPHLLRESNTVVII